MKGLVVIRVYREKRLIAVKQFLSPQIVIGRQSDAGLSLNDELISPLHAVIEKRDEGYYISDLGSESGLFIKGKKVLEALVKEGEPIEIGPYFIKFYVGIPKLSSLDDFEKEHSKIQESERKVVENKVKEVDFLKEDLPLLPKDTDLEEPYLEEDLPSLPEDTNSEVPYLEDERTSPNIILDESLDIKGEKAGVKIQSRNIEDAIGAQKLEPISGGYIAPVSNYDNVDEIIDPYSRGPILEVVICWKERILKTYHFSNKRQIFMSNSKNTDIHIPISNKNMKYKLVSFSDECIVHVASSMEGELYYDNKRENLKALTTGSALMNSSLGGKELKLDQGQMVKLNLLNGKVLGYIRFVKDTPATIKTSVFDFTTSEAVGIFMSFASVLVIALYMLFYVPSTLDDTEDLLQDRLKKAIITFNPPPKVDIPKISVPKVIKPKITKVSEKLAKVKASRPKPKVKSPKKGAPKSAAPSKVKTTNKVGSSKPGGSIKTGKKASNMKTAKKDLTKTGLLSVLSGGGKNKALNKATSGVGTTIGVADSKTGYQGQLSDRKGEDIGTKLQAGRGGEGLKLIGIGDLKTSSRGGGENTYGVGELGGKGTSTIIGLDGLSEEFSSTIDKDAIRRLIQKNKNSLKGCYDRALTQNQNLNGKVLLSWRIVNGGKMTQPKVKSSTLNDVEVEQCIISRLRILTFPDPGPNEIAEVDYPFVFSRSK